MDADGSRVTIEQAPVDAEVDGYDGWGAHQAGRGQVRRARGSPTATRGHARARALALLIAHAGFIVPYEQLRASIWGGTVVDWRSGLHQIMRDLRKALDDG